VSSFNKKLYYLSKKEEVGICVGVIIVSQDKIFLTGSHKTLKNTQENLNSQNILKLKR
jgi:hypothetical protein